MPPHPHSNSLLLTLSLSDNDSIRADAQTKRLAERRRSFSSLPPATKCQLEGTQPREDTCDYRPPGVNGGLNCSHVLRLSVTRRCVKSLPESKSNKPNKKGTELESLTKIYTATEGISTISTSRRIIQSHMN